MFIELTKGLDGDVLVWKFQQTTGKTEDNIRAAVGGFWFCVPTSELQTTE